MRNYINFQEFKIHPFFPDSTANQLYSDYFSQILKILREEPKSSFKYRQMEEAGRQIEEFIEATNKAGKLFAASTKEELEQWGNVELIGIEG